MNPNLAERRLFIAEVKTLLARLGEEIDCLGEEMSCFESSSYRDSAAGSKEVAAQVESFADTLDGLQGLAGDVRADVERLQVLLSKVEEVSPSWKRCGEAEGLAVGLR